MNSRFSDRIGVTRPVTSIQVESMNAKLRNSIWNVLLTILKSDGDFFYRAVRLVQADFLKEPLDDLPTQSWDQHRWFKGLYARLKWYDVYNLVEFIVARARAITEMDFQREKWIERFNDVLKRELSGHRFVGGILSPISNEAEVASIEEAIAEAERTGLNGVRAHLTTSLKLLGQKPDPDYRNAIKEAISAVESAANCITGSESGGLKKALSKLSSESEIHKALQQGFIKLYGYSSDEDGIRHAILEESDVGYDEAKFMIVACSAFVNFLIAKAEAASLLGN